jgi:hypothetical protein
MDRSSLEQWLDGYRRAWTSDAPADIEALFTEDATYSPWPFSKPWTGRDQIVSKWVERGDSKRQWTFEHEILAVDENAGVVRGLTTYPAQDGDPEGVYANIWLVRLDPDGRAREFAEWWVEKPSETPRG